MGMYETVTQVGLDVHRKFSTASLRGKPIGRRLGHDGRTTLQWAWIEAARAAVRRDARLRGIFNRRTQNGKQDRNRGYIAVANRMCRDRLRDVAEPDRLPGGRPGQAREQTTTTTTTTTNELACLVRGRASPRTLWSRARDVRGPRGHCVSGPPAPDEMMLPPGHRG